jgi:hypothetical protein
VGTRARSALSPSAASSWARWSSAGSQPPESPGWGAADHLCCGAVLYPESVEIATASCDLASDEHGLTGQIDDGVAVRACYSASYGCGWR